MARSGSAISTWRRIKPSVCGNKASGKCPCRREKPVAQQFWKRVSGERVVKGLRPSWRNEAPRLDPLLKRRMFRNSVRCCNRTPTFRRTKVALRSCLMMCCVRNADALQTGTYVLAQVSPRIEPVRLGLSNRYQRRLIRSLLVCAGVNWCGP